MDLSVMLVLVSTFVSKEWGSSCKVIASAQRKLDVAVFVTQKFVMKTPYDSFHSIDGMVCR
jgi:hypothetical protein